MVARRKDSISGEDKTMKRWLTACMLASAMAVLAMGAQARVTEKVEGMIAENTPLKVKSNDLWLQVGGPLMYGLQYDKYANGNVALGMGAGSWVEGFSMDLSVKFFLFSGKFSPYITLGPAFYYQSMEQNVFAGFGGAGLSYYFDEGFGLSLAYIYTQAFTESQQPFSYSFVNDQMHWSSAQLGIHLNY
jgi:hypothetical protein